MMKIDDGDSKDSSVEQQAVSFDSVICKDSPIVEVEISPFIFSNEHEPKKWLNSTHV